MSRVLLLIALLVAGGCSDSGRLSGAARGWNVVLISVDTQRADRLGGYGYQRRETSPRTDTLMFDAGVRFARAASPRGATWPAMASVLSGLYPSGHGVVRNGYRFPDDVPTLPLVLKDAGYQTGAFLNNMHKANHRGWDEFAYESGNESRLVSKAREWVRGLDPSRPFFLWAHFFGPHSPYHVAKLLDGIPDVDPSYDGPVKMGKVALDRILRDGIELGESDLEQLNAFYDGAVLATDLNVGRLIDGLRGMPGAERTLFVYTADHGEELYQHHGYLYHACSVYETVLHVPLAMVAEGLFPGAASVDQPVELIDVMPTILDLLGIEPPAEQHGVSLAPLLARPDAPNRGRPAFSQYDDTAIRTVLSDEWKLVLNPEGEVPECVPGAPGFSYPIEEVELYDLAADPGETRNLALERPELVRELRRVIRERFAALTDRSEDQDIPEDLRRELEALGYVAN